MMVRFISSENMMVIVNINARCVVEAIVLKWPNKQKKFDCAGFDDLFSMVPFGLYQR